MYWKYKNKHLGNKEFEYRGVNFIGIDYEDNYINILENISNKEKKIPNIIQMFHEILLKLNIMFSYFYVGIHMVVNYFL